MESVTTPASLNQGQDGMTSEQPKVVQIDGTTTTAAPTAADKPSLPPKTMVNYDDYDSYLTPNDEDDDGDDSDANDDSEDYDSDANADADYDYDYDYYNDPERYLRRAISVDDLPEFVAQLKLLFLDDFDGNLEPGETAEPNTRELILCPDRITQEICCCSAIACATALLQGQTCMFLDLNVPLFSMRYPLVLAAEGLDYNLVKLFLSHGARVDVFEDMWSTRRCPLPLISALKVLNTHLYLVGWTPEESIYKLLIILCLPQMKVALDTIRLLALNTENANEVFIDCAKGGKLIEMAVLLLVANERVMAPSTFQSNGGGVEGGMTMRDTIMQDFLSQADEEGGVSVYNGDNGEKRSKLIFTLILLKLFETTGGAVRSYLQSQQSHVSKERVVKDVASIFKEAGFVLKEKDIDLSNIDCESDEIKMATGTSENIATYDPSNYISMVFPTIEKYLIAESRKEVVVKDVASILEDAGFVLKDIGLSNIDSESDGIKESTGSSENIPAVEPEICPNVLQLEYSVPNRMLSPWCTRPPNPHRYPMQSSRLHWYSSSFDLLASHHVRKFSSCPFFICQKNQFKGEKNAMLRRVQPSNSSNVLVSLAMAFKRSLRRV